jgi:hypothetical protein
LRYKGWKLILVELTTEEREREGGKERQTGETIALTKRVIRNPVPQVFAIYSHFSCIMIIFKRDK